MLEVLKIGRFMYLQNESIAGMEGKNRGIGLVSNLQACSFFEGPHS